MYNNDNNDYNYKMTIMNIQITFEEIEDIKKGKIKEIKDINIDKYF